MVRQRRDMFLAEVRCDLSLRRRSQGMKVLAQATGVEHG